MRPRHRRPSLTTTDQLPQIGAELPFEFVVLETILQNVLATLDDELRELARPVDALVHALVRDGGGAGGDPARQRDLLADINIRDVLREVLENEEDLEEMSTERFITLTLDSQRNALLILEIKFAMFGVACTSGALLASLFGMNLMSGLEDGIWRMKAVTRRTQLPDALLPAFGASARPLVEVAAVGAPTPRVGTMPGSGQAHAQGQGHGQQQQDLHQRLITGLFKSFERPRFEFGHR
ncbi:hypothetical protein BCR44DRAFT_1441130 [Catenaria anguillulae PL171]|uniref:Magnesium transporter n=1 Tax=Catenaria anguillulae PL171 TaxID=765915 RepID=A0A1Y2HBJ3_9FUNG|nr:hypothetical protein BCR44DRAFT_1441130 [Catenaria anguillulae PL171]